MGGVVNTQFSLMIPHGKLAKCIAYLEDGLLSLKPTPYHQVLGQDFLHQTDELANWIIDFYERSVAAKLNLAALYLEMNGFTINPKQWHCNLFGYKQAGSVWELDWLSDWDAERQECFILHGMESVQATFAKLFLAERQPLGVKLAEEVTEHLVTARFMELVAASHQLAKERYDDLKSLPVLATVHDWDTVHQTE